MVRVEGPPKAVEDYRSPRRFARSGTLMLVVPGIARRFHGTRPASPDTSIVENKSDAMNDLGHCPNSGVGLPVPALRSCLCI